jgi:hypothetical protein
MSQTRRFAADPTKKPAGANRRVFLFQVGVFALPRVCAHAADLV